MRKDIDYYMNLDYPFSCEQFEEDGETRFGLKIPELQGVWAEGKTLGKAYDSLLKAKRLWFETCLENRIKIPEPSSRKEYSGKFVLRVNPKLHKDLKEGAVRKNESLNQYVTSVLTKHIENETIINEVERISVKLDRIDARIGSLEQTYSTATVASQTRQVYIVNPPEDYNIPEGQNVRISALWPQAAHLSLVAALAGEDWDA